MSCVTDSLIKNMVPLRIGMHQEEADVPPPPPLPEHENDDTNSTAGGGTGAYMLSRAYSAGFRKASLADTKFHTANIHEIEQKMQNLSDSEESEYYSDSEEDQTQVSLTYSAKCRKAQLDHVHKMKREIWGRAAVGIESNFSTNPKILQMKEVAFEKGVRLLEAEFGEYRDKDKRWEGLHSSRRPTLKLR